MLNDDEKNVLLSLYEANGSTFVDLVRIAGLDPAQDFKDADLAGIDFSGCDLSGYDFSGARLTGASFLGANILDTVFRRAELSNVRWPADEADEYPAPTNLTRRQKLRPGQ